MLLNYRYKTYFIKRPFYRQKSHLGFTTAATRKTFFWKMEKLHDLERRETRTAIIPFLTGAVPISSRELLWRRREKDSTRRLHLRRLQTAAETQSAHRSLYRRQATIRDLRQTGKSKSKERLIVRNLNYHFIWFHFYRIWQKENLKTIWIRSIWLKTSIMSCLVKEKLNAARSFHSSCKWL